MKKDFNDYRFEGLGYSDYSNKYFVIHNHVSEDGKKCIIKVDDSHLVQTKFGYALILDSTHVVFLKSWAVSKNYYGNFVLLNKDFWNVKIWGNHDEFSEDENELNFETWFKNAKEQTCELKWAKLDERWA